MKQSLQLKQSQSLVMTPQLQQSIKMLQLSSQELTAFLEDELEQNPLLGKDEQDEAQEEIAESAEEAPAREETDITELTGRDDVAESEEGPLDTDFGNVWEPGDSGASSGSGTHADVTAILEQTAAESGSLREHLTRQLFIDIPDAARRILGQHLIDALDGNGMLAEPLEDIAARLGCVADEAEKTLALMQRFEPAGIFARTLAECLALQLRERNRLDPAMQTLLNHLDLVARKDYAALARFCGTDIEETRDMCAELRTLNPRPAADFDTEKSQQHPPDVIVQAAPDGSYTIELNSEVLPRLLVNHQYFARIAPGARGADERRFLTDRLSKARWLVKALEQRATTILRVATEIVALEKEFFRHGIRHLRPLTLREIAETLNIHESTVSRVTANKTMSTPRGMFEMKYFFTSSIATGGDDISSETVKFLIKELISKETTVLSDDAITAALNARGIQVARRTVAKYREALGIASSGMRKREMVNG